MKTFMQPIKTCLISGATGFLGSQLVKAFLKEGLIVVGIKREQSSLSRLKTEIKNKNLYLYNANCAELRKAFQEHNVDLVIHTACCYGRKNEWAYQVIHTNIQFAMQLFEFADEYNIKYFFNTDTLLCKNVNNYTLSKKQFIEWLKKYCGKVRIVNIKLEHIYGPDDDETKFIGMLLAKLKHHEAVIPLTKGTQIRDFIFITDVVDAYITLYKNIGSFSNFNEFEVGTGLSIPVKTFVEELFNQYKAFDINCNTQLAFGAIPYRKDEQMLIYADTANLKMFGWKPKVNYVTGIKKIINSVNCAILIVSWDGGEELWKPFFVAMEKFWRYCPLKTYLLTETKIPNNLSFNSILNVSEKYTTDRICKALENINADYILLIPDDFFFNENINTERITAIIKNMDELKLDYIKFSQTENVFKFSFTPCLIKKDTLKYFTTIIPHVYAREFEVQACNIINQKKDFKSELNQYIFTNHCILEGYWNRNAYKWCRENNIPLTFKTYKRPTIVRNMYAAIKSLLFNFVLSYLPSLYKVYTKRKYEKSFYGNT